MDIDVEMRVIHFSEEDRSRIPELLQYDTWQKSDLKNDLATTTYLVGEEDKILGLYEDVDGYTFIHLYRGFGRFNGGFYRAPARVYPDLKEHLIENYLKNEKGQDGRGEAPIDDDRDGNSTDGYVPSFRSAMQDLCQRYGFGWGTILYRTPEVKEFLLYNTWENILRDDESRKKFPGN